MKGRKMTQSVMSTNTMDKSLTVPGSMDTKIFASVDRVLTPLGFECKPTSKTAFSGLKLVNDNTKVSVLVARKPYFQGWMYEVSFSINWRDVFDIAQIAWGLDKKIPWKKGGLLGIGSGHSRFRHTWPWSEFAYTSMSDFPKVSTTVENFVLEVGLPFFADWQIKKDVECSFYRPDLDAGGVTLGKLRVAQIAISMAVADHVADINALVDRLRLYIGTDRQEDLKNIEVFLDLLRSRKYI